MRHTAFVLGFILVSGRGALEAATSRPAKPLSLSEAIQTAIANNLDVAIRKKDPESARYGVTGAKAVFDPLFTSAGSYDRSASGLFTGTGANPFAQSIEEKGSNLQAS